MIFGQGGRNHQPNLLGGFTVGTTAAVSVAEESTSELSDLGIEKLPNYGQPLEKHPVDAGRLRNVIERVTRVAGWRGRQTGGRAFGLAAHRSFVSYTAVIASVVKRPNGNIAVDEVWVSFDAGTMVNTDRVRAQMEGSVIFGMSLAFYGGITMKGGAVE